MFSYSFIIPSYNSASDLLSCVKSLEKLDYHKNKYEIIIVDDGSSDNTANLIKKLKIPNLKIYCNENRGAASARNFAIEKAINDILVFLDQDVIVNKNLLNIYDWSFNTTKADIVQGNIWEQIIVNRTTQLHALWRKVAFINKVQKNNGFIKTIITRNVAVKKKTLVKVKEKYGFIFNESFRGTGGEDRELGYRLNELGFNIYLEPKAVVKHKDPGSFKEILLQKYKHAQGDVRLGIGEKILDLNNFNRAVIIPIKEGIPFYFAFMLWSSHLAGSEIQRFKIFEEIIRIRFYYFVKRTLDVFLSLMAIIFGFPLFLLIAILIKLDSKGPVIFKQKRMGLGGKEFWMFKFRTMVVDAEKILENSPKLLEIYKKNSYKIKNDPRITKIGIFLRKSSLDELPQVFNILKGDMAIVGPRAYKKDEIENQVQIHKDLKKYAIHVINTKPGLTGIWQTSGRSEIGFENRIILDYQYAIKRNIFFDLLLILKTFPIVLKSKGAW